MTTHPVPADVPVDWDRLYQAARDVRERAHAPYSRFFVGAALLTADGRIFAGCNVENRSYGLCICAERSAITAAVAAGIKDLKAIAVVTDMSPPALPCGMCRETLNEFGEPLLPVMVANLEGERRIYTLGELHPSPFKWDGPQHAD